MSAGKIFGLAARLLVINARFRPHWGDRQKCEREQRQIEILVGPPARATARPCDGMSVMALCVPINASVIGCSDICFLPRTGHSKRHRR